MYLYFKDGTGQPEDDELEIESLEIISLRNEDTDTDWMDKYNNDKDYREEIEEAIADELYNSDEWENAVYEYEEDYE